MKKLFLSLIILILVTSTPSFAKFCLPHDKLLTLIKSKTKEIPIAQAYAAGTAYTKGMKETVVIPDQYLMTIFKNEKDEYSIFLTDKTGMACAYLAGDKFTLLKDKGI